MNERIKNTSKAGQKKAREAAVFAYAHKAWTYDDIYSAYKKPSVYKVRAWNWCKELCREMHGYDLIISSAGNQTFSVVFTFNERGTGRKCFAYITRDYNRFCYAEDVKQEEKESCVNALLWADHQGIIKGNFETRWFIMSAIYHAFLSGTGYHDPLHWRENEEDEAA